VLVAPLEQLSAPPIFEVICGLVFEPIPELNPVSIGKYWAAKQDTYPTTQVHPGLADEAQLVLSGLPPLRVWLVSEDDEFVLQIQTDRFYVNWRARGREYPRFSDHGERKGIRTRFLEEFKEFSSFCEREFARQPKAVRVELAKVDQFVESSHWDGFQDLARLVPWLRDFAAFSKSGDPGLSVRFGEQKSGGSLAVLMDLGRLVPDARQPRILKLETRVSRSLVGPDDELREHFERMNEELNDVFASLVPDAQRSRFQG
jgi:uncharacterized protein (TIGR04255 family)